MAAKPFSSGHILTAADVNDLTGVIDRSTSTVDVVSTTTLTSVYSKSLAAGSGSTDRVWHLVIMGDALNTTGNLRGLQLQVILGATTIYDNTGGSIWNSSAFRAPWILELFLANKASASVQELEGSLRIGTNLAPAAGIGDWSADKVYTFGGTAAENTASAKTLDIKIAPTQNHASMSVRKKFAVLELL